MTLDEMTEQQILDAESRGDQEVIAEMEARLRRRISSIEIAGKPGYMSWQGVPNSAANQLIVKRAAKVHPGVTIGIRID